MYGVLMAGTNFVLSTTGYLESAMCQSYAKWVLDSEQLEMMYRLGGGVSFEGLDEVLDTIRQVPPGGHHLGTPHTLANFQTAFSMPEMMNSDNYEQWLADGAMSAEERATSKCLELLETYEEPRLPDDVRTELDEFIARRALELPDTVTYNRNVGKFGAQPRRPLRRGATRGRSPEERPGRGEANC